MRGLSQLSTHLYSQFTPLIYMLLGVGAQADFVPGRRKP